MLRCRLASVLWSILNGFEEGLLFLYLYCNPKLGPCCYDANVLKTFENDGKAIFCMIRGLFVGEVYLKDELLSSSKCQGISVSSIRSHFG